MHFLMNLFFPDEFHTKYLCQNKESRDLQWLKLDELWIGNNLQIDGIGGAAYFFSDDHLYLRVKIMFFITCIFKIPLIEITSYDSKSAAYPKFQFSVKGKSAIDLALGHSDEIRSQVQNTFFKMKIKRKLI